MKQNPLCGAGFLDFGAEKFFFVRGRSSKIPLRHVKYKSK